VALTCGNSTPILALDASWEHKWEHFAATLVTVSKRSSSRGHIEERPNGTFRAVVSAGVDPLSGQRRMLRQTAATKKLAEKALTDLLHQVDQQTHARSDITLARPSRSGWSSRSPSTRAARGFATAN
jgi:hypothetical protein